MEIAFRPISFHIKIAYKFIKRLSCCCCCYCTQMESIYFMLSFKSCFTSQRPATLAATCHPQPTQSATHSASHPAERTGSQTALLRIAVLCFALLCFIQPACLLLLHYVCPTLSHTLAPQHGLVVALPSLLAVELLAQLLRLRLRYLDFSADL